MTRPLFVALSLLSLGSLRVCGGETDAAPPQAAAGATVTATGPTTIPVMGAPPGRRGGTVVVAGTHQVEVVPKADGQIIAYVAGPGGSVPAPSLVNLTVTVQGVDAQAHPVVLAWDAAELRYEGRLVGVAPAPGPAQVTLVVSGTPVVATAPMIVIVPATLTVEHGDVRVARDSFREANGQAPEGRAVGTVTGVNVEVRGPEGHVEVRGDGQDIDVQGPEGRVEVRGPAGRVEVRGAGDHGDVRVVAPGVFIQPPSGRLNINLGGAVQVGEDDDGDDERPRGHGHGRGHEHDD